MKQLTTPTAAVAQFLDARSPFAASSFVCPHCGAFTQQSWGQINSARVPGPGMGKQRAVTDAGLLLASCSVCNRESIFRGRQLVYPPIIDAPAPSPDMPAAICADFEEARQIAGRSPRGAAALLRLSIQKLCPIIGADEADINTMIGQLVAEEKIPALVQRALDSVRVIGNEAVHPGTIDLKDDAATVNALFGLVNIIVERAITEPKQIGEIFGSLPPGKLAGIAQRDG